MRNYEHQKIEQKWKSEWYKCNLYEAVDFDPKPKKYILAELPYPSGKALHAGHMMRFTVPDIYSRYLRLKGYNVLFPIGWDAFGLPAENYAIKTGTHPAKLIHETVGHYKDSIQMMGYSIDWNREIDTTDPKYYKWTQWIFLQFFKAGLAKYKEMPIWWCEGLKTVLSDEEVITDKDGNKISERGELPVVKKNLKQWILDIKKYADKLLEGLDTVDYPEAIKAAQTNWIGKSDGASIIFKLVNGTKNELAENIEVYTTRPDTIFGVTFVVVAPEHKLVAKLLEHGENKEEINKYLDFAKNLSDLERLSNKEKTGTQVKGVFAKHPLTGKEIPVYIADYVLIDYGTGAVMGVPGHDDRDFDFARKFNIPVIKVIEPTEPFEGEFYTGKGVMMNSAEYSGQKSEDFFYTVIKKLEELGLGSAKTAYKLRDWVFSRQRYWGEPIPIIHKQNGDIEPICNVDDPKSVNSNLPLTLPDVPDFTPTSDGASPLERNTDWVNTKDSQGNPAKRETNTMPNWAGSCWYYIRYIDAHNDNAFADAEKLKYWLPVDRYFGGAEHTTMHLLYSRFWHRFLFDQGFVPTKEPYAWRLNGGLLLGPDGKKMSKSRGNVVEPIDLIEKYGADALRMFIAFLGPYEETYPWNENGIKATSRLIKNIYDLGEKVNPNAKPAEVLTKAFHKMVKNITGMLENLKMNTAISEFMIFMNTIKDLPEIDTTTWKDFLKLLAPFAPFVAEELWQEANRYTTFNKDNSVHKQNWPTYDESYLIEDTKVLGVQINGKARGEIETTTKDTEATIREKVMQVEKLRNYIGETPIKKVIYIPGKIVNVVL